MTDFPNQGDDLKISLRNSERPQFDFSFASSIKESEPEIWKAGGNIRGNEAFTLWSRARDGEETEGVLDWIKEREAWAARHAGDGSQFPGASPTLSSIAGVVAAMKWGVILDIGESTMKDAVMELVKKREGKQEDRAWDDGLSSSVATGIENKVEEYNEDISSDDTTHRATLPMAAAVFKRGVGAYKTNPSSVRPQVKSPEQWAYARLRSFLFALKNERFQGGQHDTDLFPSGHPLRGKAEEEEKQRARVGEIDGTPVFSTAAEAEAYAEKMGCSGHHTHELEGETVYMPCSSHDMATEEDGEGGGGGYREAPCGCGQANQTNTTTMTESHELKHEELKVERRYLSMNVESRDEEGGDGKTVEGYAAVFNADADLGGFTERIEPGAFDAALADPKLDVAALFNHDQNQILARNRGGEGNLELWTDDKGLKYRFKLGDQSYAQDLAINLRMGLVNQSSFAFSIKEDEWGMRDGRDHRTIKAVQLHDISPVVFPAYQEATASIRSQEQEQPTQEPAVTSSRDRAQAQLAIYNLTK